MIEKMNSNEYDEISLKELIHVVINGKKIILAITILCLLIASIFTFMILTPMYESTAVLYVSNATDKQVGIDQLGTDNIMDVLTGNAAQTLATYTAQMKTDDMMRRVIKTLDLENEGYSVGAIKSMLTFSNIKGTNLIEIKATSPDSDLSAKLANTVADEFTKFVTEKNRSGYTKSIVFLEKKITEEKTKLDTKLIELNAFKTQTRGIAEVQQEIATSLSRFNSYKNQLKDLELQYKKELLNNEIAIESSKNTLAKVASLLDDVEMKNITENSIVDDTLFTSIALSEEIGLETMSELNYIKEEINPNYLDFQRKHMEVDLRLVSLKQDRLNISYKYNSMKEYYGASIISLTEELEKLQAELFEKENQGRFLNEDASRIESTYRSFVAKYEESRIAESVEIGDSMIQINSKAYASNRASSPNKKMNLAIGVILGIMLGVFVVFLKKYLSDDIISK